MDGRNRQTSLTVAVLLAASLGFGSLPAIGAAPQPVLPEGSLPKPGAPDGRDPIDLEDPADEARCFGELSASIGTAPQLGHPDSSGLQQARYPGPMLPVEAIEQKVPARSPCLVDLTLRLQFDPLEDRRPAGANASLRELQVPRSALESGFHTQLPTESVTTITLADPGAEWKLTATSCTCLGEAFSAQRRGFGILSSPGMSGLRTTYPEPLLPVDPTKRKKVSGTGCSGSAGSIAASAGTDQLTSPHEGSSSRTTYPGPVLPVRGRPKSAPREPDPPPPPPVVVTWDASGTVKIRDPDRIGANVICVWAVEWVNGRFTINTITDPPGEEGRFEYTVTPADDDPRSSARSMQGAPPSNDTDLRSGTWLVELTNLGEVWEVTDSECRESDETTFSFANGPGATLGVDADDVVSCDFSLLGPIVPEEGQWVMRNTRTQLKRCRSPAPVKIANQKPVTVVVQTGEEAEVLDVTGRSGGKKRTFHLPFVGKRTYAGTETQRGGKVKHRWTVKSPTQITGTITAKAKQCDLVRTVRMSHTGPDR